MSAVRSPNTPEHPAETSRYSRLFWCGVAVGWVGIGSGIWSALTHAGSTQPLSLALWVTGLALVHDLLLVPAVLIVAWLVRRTAPRVARGLLLGALAVSAIIALVALPFALRLGAQADNPSFLPRNVGLGALVLVSGVWAVAAGMLFRRLRRERRRS